MNESRKETDSTLWHRANLTASLVANYLMTSYSHEDARAHYEDDVLTIHCVAGPPPRWEYDEKHNAFDDREPGISVITHQDGQEVKVLQTSSSKAGTHPRPSSSPDPGWTTSKASWTGSGKKPRKEEERCPSYQSKRPRSEQRAQNSLEIIRTKPAMKRPS